jgi:hypothetical protein
MEQLGVSPKQKERARQTFAKSGQDAGFINSATGGRDQQNDEAAN